MPGPNDQAVINLPGNFTVTHNYDTADSVAGLTCTQTLDLAAGSLAIGSPSTIKTLDITGGTAVVQSGSLNVTNFSQSAGATYLGANKLTAANTTWTGGTLAGSRGVFDAIRSLTIDSASPLMLNGIVLNNHGTATWIAGNIGTKYGSTFNNLAGATFLAQSDATFHTTFHNAGTFTLNGKAVTNIDTLTNSGSVLLKQGNLNVGTYVQKGGVANLAGNTLTAANATWTGGTIDGGGYLDLTKSLLLAGTANSVLDAVVVNNSGIATWASGNIGTISGSTFNNLTGAGFTAQSNTTFNTTFNNAGTFTLNGNAVTSLNALNNSGNVTLSSGTLSTNSFVQSAGATYLGGNTLNALKPIRIDGGSLFGSGTIIADLVNGGQVSPGAIGTLTVNGNYTQTSSGALGMAVGGPDPGPMDQLQVSGTATFGGKLNVRFVNGYTPTPTGVYTVVHAGAVARPFDSVSIANPSSVALQVVYGANSVAIAPVPPPPPPGGTGTTSPAGSAVPGTHIHDATFAFPGALTPQLPDNLIQNLAIGRYGSGNASVDSGAADSTFRSERFSFSLEYHQSAGAGSVDDSGADDDLVAALLAASGDWDRALDIELLSGFALGTTLLTHSHPKADILPQKGSRVAPVATLLSSHTGDEALAQPDSGGDDDLPLRDLLIDPLRKGVTSPAAAKPLPTASASSTTARVVPTRPRQNVAATTLLWALLFIGATTAFARRTVHSNQRSNCIEQRRAAAPTAR